MNISINIILTISLISISLLGCKNANFDLNTLSSNTINISAPVITDTINSTTVTSITVTGTCDILNATISFSHGIGSAICDGTNYNTIINFTGESEGPIDLSASIIGVSGNTIASPTSPTFKDTLVAVPTLTSPAGGSVINDLNQTIQGSCESGATVFINGDITGAPETGTCTGGVYAINVTFTSGDGIKGLIINQTDLAGNTSLNLNESVELLVVAGPITGGNFITTWQTTAANQEVGLRNVSVGANFNVDWGDGTPIQNVSSFFSPGKSHVYSLAGTYTVTISGIVIGLDLDPAFQHRLIEVNNLGNVGWQNLANAFRDCPNLTLFQGGDTELVTDMRSMFSDSPLVTPDTRGWNTSSLEEASGMFRNASSANPDTSGWDMSSVTDADGMFNNATSANPDTSNWVFSSLQNGSLMFLGATSAAPNTTNWDMGLLEQAGGMFLNAPLANPDMSSWDFSSIVAISGLFDNSAINNLNYSNFLLQLEATSPVTLTTGTFTTTAQFQAGAAAARTSLIGRGLTLNDGGPE